MERCLKGRVCLVTGGSSGIGRGISIELARRGSSVVIADLQEDSRKGKYETPAPNTTTVQEIEKLGGRGLFVRTDVSDENSVRSALEQTIRHFEGIDILVNNAAVLIPGDSQQLSVADWDRVLAVNLRALFLTTKFSVPFLKQSRAGRIINISSVAAFFGGGGPAYTAAKAAVVNLTRDSALELAPDGITVNAVCPGFVQTSMHDTFTEEKEEQLRQGTPLKRAGTPAEIGRACVFLASDDAAWITGIALPVDGGWLAQVHT